MKIICPIENCTGCSSCFNICPREAIKMSTDQYGFLYPDVLENICIDCNLCKKVCPAINQIQQHDSLNAYAALCSEECHSSSSGGAAAAITNYILSIGGVVYGCAQYNYKDIRHIRISADNINDKKLLKGSKYVQSSIGRTFKQIQTDLKNGFTVLFIGTPCQVAGLKRFLMKEYSNLYTVDLVCHGVPSSKMLVEDISKIKNVLDSDSVIFRENVNGKVCFGIFIKDFNGKLKTRIKFPNDSYLTAFMMGLSFRESCHQCKYANSSRVGDLTLADFWGLGEDSVINTSNGISLILVNTQTGKELFDKFSFLLSFEERSIDEAIRGNGQLQKAFERPVQKDIFLSIYMNKGIRSAVNKVGSEYISFWRKQYLKEEIIDNLSKYPFLLSLLRKIKKII